MRSAGRSDDERPMPSPVAHSLIGLALGAAWLLPRTAPPDLLRRAWAMRGPFLIAVFAANAPDLDYLPGIAAGNLNAFHHGLTHTIPFVVLVAAVIVALWRTNRPARAGGWLTAMGLSHLAADMVTQDLRAPYGIPVAWPLSSDHFIAPFYIFGHLRKREWSEFLQTHNFQMVGIEMLLTLPLLVAVMVWKSRATRAA